MCTCCTFFLVREKEKVSIKTSENIDNIDKKTENINKGIYIYEKSMMNKG